MFECLNGCMEEWREGGKEGGREDGKDGRKGGIEERERTAKVYEYVKPILASPYLRLETD